MRNPSFAGPKLVAEAIKAAERERQGNYKLPHEFQERAALHNRRMAILRYIQRQGEKV